MADDSPEPLTPSPDPGRARRAPPTIDLEASEISSETRKAAQETEAEPEPAPEGPSREPARGISAGIIAAISGAVAAALVIAVVWFAGWPGAAVPPAPAPQADTAAIDALTSRVAAVEAKTAKPAAADPAVTARIEALEKSVAALRGELTSARAESQKLATDIKDVKSAPNSSAATPDLGPINDRLTQLERADRTQSAAIAQESAKPADDPPLRRIVAATLLDVLVRTGEPYGAELTAAKSLAPDPAVLKPLDPFAASGVPTAALLSRELLTLVPKLQPPPAEGNSTAGAGLV